jgi:hypothetical protein
LRWTSFNILFHLFSFRFNIKMKNIFAYQLSVCIGILIISSIAINFTHCDSLNELSDYLTQLIDRGLVAQALKQELDNDLKETGNKLLLSNGLFQLDKDDTNINSIKPKRFYRWPSAATRTRVKLLNNQPQQNDAKNNDYFRRKELEKNMIEKNRMYQYFHG